MNLDFLLNVILSSVLAVIQLLAYVVCIVWRKKKYRKGLHYSTAGFAALFLSAFFGIFLPIGGFTFLSGGEAGTNSLIFAVVFCPIALVISIKGICFCIFLEGNEVVKRTLFHETKIDLSDQKTSIYDNEPFTITFYITVKSPRNQTIRFNSRRIEGDLESFLKQCKKIHTNN